MPKYPPLRVEVFVKIDDGEYVNYETFTDEEKKEIGRKIQKVQSEDITSITLIKLLNLRN